MKTLRTVVFVLSSVMFPALLLAQSWQYTASLSEAKRTGILITLPNETAIYVGGADAQGLPLASCEIFDPATATWKSAASMTTPRERHTATLLPDGRLVVIGGNMSPTYDWSQATGSIEIYDYTTDAWSSGGNLNIPRQNHTATLLNNGKILVTGGNSNNQIINSCEIYDPSTGTSTNVAPLLLARHDHAATLLPDGNVLISGGRTGGSGSDYLTESEVYDVTNDTWTRIGDMAQARIKGLLATLDDGTVLAAAGRNSPNSTAPGSEILASPYSSWASTSSMLMPVSWCSSNMLPNDRFLVTGGFYDSKWNSSFTAVTTPTCEWYDRADQKWYYAPDMNQKRCYHDACYIHQTVNDELPQDFILVASGLIADYQFTATAEYLDVTEPALLSYKAMASNASAGVRTGVGDVSAQVDQRTSDQATLSLSLPTAANVHYRVFSITGITVGESNEINLTPGNYAFDLSDKLPTGVYFVEVSINDQEVTQKFAIVR